MRRSRAAVGSALFFLAAPCVVAGVLPWWLAGWPAGPPRSWPAVVLAVAGVLLIAAGAIVLVRAFVRFVDEGRGTPAPVAPTKELVVGGEYRYVRNPMYVAVVAIAFGQASVLRSGVVAAYAAVAWLGMAAFVHWYEEPHLSRRFGAAYDRYRDGVPAWLPRLRPWGGW